MYGTTGQQIWTNVRTRGQQIWCFDCLMHLQTREQLSDALTLEVAVEDVVLV